MNNICIHDFLSGLSSADPTPGGGGVAALAGALGSCLCAMVSNLTSGKKKYAEYQEDIERILGQALVLRTDLESLITKDAEAFAPLARAYGIPKDDPSRESILEEALKVAAEVPAQIVRTASKITDLLEELAVKGSKLAVSDVGVAASLCRSSLESGVLNVYINTKLMKDRKYAEALNEEMAILVDQNVERCCLVYEKVSLELRGL